MIYFDVWMFQTIKFNLQSEDYIAKIKAGDWLSEALQ